MRERRRDYELMFIISPLHTNEESIAAIIERIKHTITTSGGEVVTVDHSPPWGRRKLAYPIREYAGGEASRRNFTEGFYVLLHFSLASSKVSEVERTLKLTDPVLRHLITVVERRKQPLRSVPVEEVSTDTGGEEDEELVEENEE